MINAGVFSPDLLSTVRLAAFDFDGVFTDNSVIVNQDGIESVRCWRSDGIGIERLRSIGVVTVIISSEINPIVLHRAKKLNVLCKYGVTDKAAEILSICRTLCVDPKETMFVGNDINDIPAFESIGIPVGVADSHPEILSYILYQTQKRGGFGAVREVCDLVFNAKRAPHTEPNK